MSNERAKALLERAGLECESEPVWITEGQKSDYFCHHREEFWCEVKTLGLRGADEGLWQAHDDLGQRAEKIESPGRGLAWVHSDADPRDAKMLMSLLERALPRFADQDAPERLVIAVPADPIYNEFVTFSLSTREHSHVEFHGCVSMTDKYGRPPDMFPEPLDQRTKLLFSSRPSTEVLVRDVLSLTDDFRIAAELWPDDRPFAFIATAPSGPAKRLKNPERVRQAVGVANSQFKNAVKYKDVPCLAMIFHDGLEVPEEVVVVSALYGDLTYCAPREEFESGQLGFGKNGAWTPTKNRTTSALMYVRNEGQPMLIHNLWAQRPFPRGVFNCKEIVAHADGTFAETARAAHSTYGGAN